MDAYLEKMLRLGYIRESHSEAASPCLFVTKKDSTLRLCVDYRGLNKVTVKSRYPLPLIDDLLGRLSKGKYFTTLDLRNGYHLVRIAEGDEWKTAFRTRHGLFEYLVMPFGLTNPPATFQHFMNHTLRGLLDKNVECYLDDIVIYSETLEEHVQHVRAVLDRLKQQNLYAKISKCDFHKSSVRWLGYVVSHNGLAMDPEKTDVIRNWPIPRQLRDVRSFLGFSNFYRGFINNYSAITTPMTELTKKGREFVWAEPQQKAFELLKSKMGQAPVLRHFVLSDLIVIETDASDYAIGAILSQIDKGNTTRPVAFLSRKMLPAELNYPVHNKEFLVIHEAFKKWRHYLEGAQHTVQVLTDHCSLQYFLTTKQLSRRQARWSEYMSSFDLQIQYRKGKDNTQADNLSRRFDYQPSDGGTNFSYELNPFNYRTMFTPSIMTTVTGLANPLTTELVKEYARDDEYNQLVSTITNDRRLSILDNGLLLHDKAIYIPKSMRTRMMHLCHSDKTAGHPGRDKTLHNTTKRFWWPTIRHDVIDFVKSCIDCQKTKPIRQKPKGQLMPLPSPDRPWQHVTADFITKLPESLGYDSILVFVDRFTKVGIFVPCNERIRASDFAELFHEFVYSRFGLPESITTDRGSHFTSNYWRAMAEAYGITHNLSTAYHPQTDGQTERVNQRLEQYLRLYIDFAQSDWVQ